MEVKTILVECYRKIKCRIIRVGSSSSNKYSSEIGKVVGGLDTLSVQI